MGTAAAFLVAAAQSSMAAVSLTFTGIGFGGSPFSVTYPTDYVGGSSTRGGLFLGEIIMTPAGEPSLRTYCVSPAGTVGSGAYDLLTFEAAKFGNNPPAWAVSGGIENASYLFHNFAASVADNDHGAAMQLAILELIYDSTGLGTVTGGGLTAGRFQATGVSAAVNTEVNDYINQVLVAGSGIIDPYYADHPGYILRPQAAGGQDLITFMVPLEAVPEAGTIVAGIVLLLPGGIMFLRRFGRRGKTGAA